MPRFLPLTSLMVLLVALTACSRNAPHPQLVAVPVQVTLRLALAADRAANALDTLASIDQVRTPTDLPPLAAGAPAELRRSVTVNWYGNVEPLLKMLADRASYRFLVTGNKPENALIVTVNVRNQPVIETLRDVGLQMGTRAQVKVDAAQQVIELNYGQVQIDSP